MKLYIWIFCWVFHLQWKNWERQEKQVLPLIPFAKKFCFNTFKSFILHCSYFFCGLPARLVNRKIFIGTFGAKIRVPRRIGYLKTAKSTNSSNHLFYYSFPRWIIVLTPSSINWSIPLFSCVAFIGSGIYFVYLKCSCEKNLGYPWM